MISYIDAKRILLSNVCSLSNVVILSLNSLDRICFDNIYSDYNVPYFNNSAMDGYAIRSSETKLATCNNPLVYKVVGCQFAGQNIYFKNVDFNCTIEIMTGAILPSNFDAVIKKEEIEVIYINGIKYILLKNFVKLFENVKIFGEDILKYDLIIKKGKIITSSDIMLLMSLNIKYINVYKTPKIVLICTGEEIIHDQFSLINGYIYNSTYFYLKSFFYRLNIEFYYYGKIIDNFRLFFRVIKQIQILDNPEIIISTGGVSQGKCDFIVSALSLMNVTILFNGIFIKPGKPLIFVKFNDCHTYFFGLPGNPISSVIGIRFFVYPLIRKLLFLSEENGIKVKINHVIYKKFEYTNFLRSVVYKINDEYFVDCLHEQESFKIYSFSKTFFWVLLKEGYNFYNLYDYVDVFSYEPCLWRNIIYEE